MRRRIRSLTRRQLLAYIFLDGAARIEGTDTPVREMTKRVLGDAAVSWGYSGKAEQFYKQIKNARVLAKSDDELFHEFLKKHTLPMEDMVEKQRVIQLALHEKQLQGTKSSPR